MENKKILFVVSSYHQYQTYIKTEALKEIKDQAIFLVNQKLTGLDFGVSKDRIIPYSYPDRKDILHRHVFNINSWRKKKQHPVFLLRLAFLRPRQEHIYRILSLPILNNIVKFIFLKRAQDNNLAQLIKRVNPDILVLPSHAFEGITFELIRIAKKIKTPSLMIVDNWDTLATKTIFTIKPEYLGVWGQQHVEQAVYVRDMPKERVFILGTPKFISYMKPEARHQTSPYPFPYVLYAGMSDLFNELGALRRIDDIIEKRKINLKIVYRPNVTQHTRNCPDVFFEYDFKHVILDAPARLYYKKSATWDITRDGFNPAYYPDCSYYPKLLSNMEFMICAHSTMILEAALFDKKMYLLAFDDGIHRLGPRWYYENCYHLFGVERLKDARMVRAAEDTDKIFTPGDQLKEQVKPLDIDYFVAKEATANYPANLKKVVDTILANWRQNKTN